ncbi:MAG TPA: UDP-N-acetylglucosamine 2-epimerase (non-hydrolyzing) [Gemmatimonadaceae bacterium]|nr:UDP-N-acetylglucosamine 2-epimerase (non-hydrolyzing) [Gemmatimonadaceae bacterium]
MRKVLTVIGARPQFIKAGPVSAALATRVNEVVVNTGQHYDYEMSDVFFRDLNLRSPDHFLGVGSGTHAAQTGAMLEKLEPVMVAERPDVVLVYGDTNSTLAGALTAIKLGIPVAHVEAGLRSYNRAMPEEINRVLTDHVASLLFAPSEVSRQQLASEGITAGVHITGDVMYDAILRYAPIATQTSAYPQLLNVAPGGYYLCTVHRAENTDDAGRLGRIFAALRSLGKPVVIPLHPRTRKKIAEFGIEADRNVQIIDPVGYIDMLQLLQKSAALLTDSGGLQKESYYAGVPCVTLRGETEWTETVDAGWNVLAGQDPKRIAEAVSSFNGSMPARAELYGDGKASERIAQLLCGDLS